MNRFDDETENDGRLSFPEFCKLAKLLRNKVTPSLFACARARLNHLPMTSPNTLQGRYRGCLYKFEQDYGAGSYMTTWFPALFLGQTTCNCGVRMRFKTISRLKKYIEGREKQRMMLKTSWHPMAATPKTHLLQLC